MGVNTTIKVCIGNCWFILRFYVRDKKLVSIEKSVYQLVQDVVSVPKVLYTASEPYPFAIFEFCKYPHIYDVHKKHSDRLSYDLGKALAEIHSLRFPFAGLFGENLSIQTEFKGGSSPYFEYCLEHLTPDFHVWDCLGEARSNQVIEFIEKNQNYFPKIQEGGCLVHSDFKPVNLLWSEKEGLVVLDWEFAHSGDPVIDFGILLRHFQEFPLKISHLEKGYQANGGKLDVDWIQKARITDFVNVIQLLNRPSERPKLFKSLIESLEFTITHWEEFDRYLWS